MDPAALQGPSLATLNAHLQTLRATITDTLELQKAVVALLDRYTAGAQRVASTAERIRLSKRLPATCKARVAVHLGNRLAAQGERADAAQRALDAALSAGGPAEFALGKFEPLARQAHAHATQIQSCVDRCDTKTQLAFVQSSRKTGGAIGSSSSSSSVAGADAGADVPGDAPAMDCPSEARKLRADLEMGTESVRGGVEAATGELAHLNRNAGQSLTGNRDGDLQTAQDQAAQVNEFLEAKKQHDALSTKLADLVNQRADVLDGAKLAREQANKVTSMLRDRCNREVARRSGIVRPVLNETQGFLDSLHAQVDALQQQVDDKTTANDLEEQHAMALANKVEGAASACMATLSGVLDHIHAGVAAHHAGDPSPDAKQLVTDHATQGVLAVLTTAATAEKEGQDPLATEWAAGALATHRQRMLNGGPSTAELPLPEKHDAAAMLLETAAAARAEDGARARARARARAGRADDQTLDELQRQAQLVENKLEKAERTGKVGDRLPADLVGNAEATSEEFWKDVSEADASDLDGMNAKDEKAAAGLIKDVSQMDDDLINPQREGEVPLEYAKVAEKLGELKGDGDI